MKAVYAADPWHMQNILEDFVKLEVFGNPLHKNMDRFLMTPRPLNKTKAAIRRLAARSTMTQPVKKMRRPEPMTATEEIAS
ncbi:MAG: hypothetical protein ACUVQM_05545 [Candidatus Hadarchaeaceae archaeon]